MPLQPEDFNKQGLDKETSEQLFRLFVLKEFEKSEKKIENQIRDYRAEATYLRSKLTEQETRFEKKLDDLEFKLNERIKTEVNRKEKTEELIAKAKPTSWEKIITMFSK